MSITLAGSMGGLRGRSLSNNSKLFHTKLFNGSLSFSEFCQWFKQHRDPKVVSLVINNTCNLRCRHCYLQVEALTAPPLELAEWKMVIDSIALMRPGLICLSGKEIFVDAKGPDLLLYLKEVRDRFNGSPRIGFITNGTLLHRYKDIVLATNPDYLDISLDGMESDHDAIRGKGTFAKTLPNIEWAAATFKERFYISLTIQKQNAQRLIRVVDYLQGKGIRNISTAFYKPLPYTDQDLVLSPIEVEQVFDDLHALGELRADDPVNVMLDLDISHLPSIIAFVQSDWFTLEFVQEDDNGNFFVRYELGNNVSLSFRLNLFPPGVSRVRITPEGNLLAAGDTVNTATYAEYAIGNTRDFKHDFSALHQYALESPRMAQIVQEYYNNALPLLIEKSKRTNYAFASNLV